MPHELNLETRVATRMLRTMFEPVTPLPDTPGAAAIPPVDHPAPPAGAWARMRERGVLWLRQDHREVGFWVGRLQSNSCMEAEWVLCQHVLGVEDDPKYAGVIEAIWRERRDDGAWAVYYGSRGGDINTTVEAYTALRCAGVSPED
ncbi:MAG: hypothetical protein ACFB21_14570, partial [Opitutales bacterium]